MADIQYQPDCVCEGDVEVHQKRDHTIRVEIEDTANAWGDITSAKLWFSVKEDIEDTDANALITKKSLNNGGADTQAIVTVATGTLKKVEFYIVQDDTDPGVNTDATEGDYICDAVIELAVGSRYQLIPPTRFTIIAPVTLTT
jgi:hypothetical protein